jgi:hypothetical protein
MTASQPDACIDAASGQRVHYQVMPGLRVDGKVLRKCRVVLQPIAAAVTSDEGTSAAGDASAAAAAELPAPAEQAAAPPRAADKASQTGE